MKIVFIRIIRMKALFLSVVDSLECIQDKILNFRNIDLANKYLKDRSYSVQDDLTININRNYFNEKYFFKFLILMLIFLIKTI